MNCTRVDTSAAITVNVFNDVIRRKNKPAVKLERVRSRTRLNARDGAKKGKSRNREAPRGRNERVSRLRTGRIENKIAFSRSRKTRDCWFRDGSGKLTSVYTYIGIDNVSALAPREVDDYTHTHRRRWRFLPGDSSATVVLVTPKQFIFDP